MDDDADREEQQARDELKHEQDGQLDGDEYHGRQQQYAARHAIDPVQPLDQGEAERKGALAAGVLHGMRHLVRGHGHRRDRAPVMMRRS